MKTQEEIEQIAVDIIKTRFNETDGYHKIVYVEAYIKGYSQCQEDNKDEYRWTFSEIFDACFPTLGRAVGIWAAIAKRLIEQKENKQD